MTTALEDPVNAQPEAEYRKLVTSAAEGKAISAPRALELFFQLGRSRQQFNRDVQRLVQRRQALVEQREAGKMGVEIQATRQEIADLARKLESTRAEFEQQLVPLANEIDRKEIALRNMLAEQQQRSHHVSEIFRSTADTEGLDAAIRPVSAQISELERKKAVEDYSLPRQLEAEEKALAAKRETRAATAKGSPARESVDRDIEVIEARLESLRAYKSEVDAIPDQVAKLRAEMERIRGKYADPAMFKLCD